MTDRMFLWWCVVLVATLLVLPPVGLVVFGLGLFYVG